MNTGRKTRAVDSCPLPPEVDRLSYHCLEVRLTATREVRLDAWPGAILRNNLLFAASRVAIDNTTSLRDLIDRCPLHADHPMYKELKDGFPKGYLIALPDEFPVGVSLPKGAIFSFSLYLIGTMAAYYREFIQAIRILCQRGIGHPPAPFSLIEVWEQAANGQQRIISSGQEDGCELLAFPTRFSDCRANTIPPVSPVFTVRYRTPVILFRYSVKKDTSTSYQDKSNGFPGLYQLVRSAVARITKLTILYSCPDKTDVDRLTLESLNEWIDGATQARLLAVEMQKTTFKNTLKKETDNHLPLSGYRGWQQYEGIVAPYWPLLKYMEALGVGNETVYGMGRYEVEEVKPREIMTR